MNEVYRVDFLQKIPENQGEKQTKQHSKILAKFSRFYFKI
jgi:hypothetical protein